MLTEFTLPFINDYKRNQFTKGCIVLIFPNTYINENNFTYKNGRCYKQLL